MCFQSRSVRFALVIASLVTIGCGGDDSSGGKSGTGGTSSGGSGGKGGAPNGGTGGSGGTSGGGTGGTGGSNIVPADRLPPPGTWESAGVEGGIPERTKVCAT